MLHCCTHTNKTLYWHRNYIHVNTTHHNVNTLLHMCTCIHNIMYACTELLYMYVYNTVIAASAMLHLYMYLHTLHVTKVSFTWTGRLHRGHGEISVYRPVATVFIHKYLLTVATCKGYTIVKTITQIT